MKTIINIVAFLLNSVVGYLPPEECPMGNFYHELKCTAYPLPPDKPTCPEYYACSQEPPSVCTYRDKSYDNNTIIPRNEDRNRCLRKCHCSIRRDDRFSRIDPTPQIICATTDCEGATEDLDCINTYSVTSCCNTGVVCGKDIDKLKTCVVDGVTYREGQQIEPAGIFKLCVCTADWNGNYNDKHLCRKINCGTQIAYQAELKYYCAPVFINSNMTGCPIKFVCAGETTEWSQTSVPEKCQFANEVFEVGTEVKVNDKCVTCTCLKPPFVGCVKKENC